MPDLCFTKPIPEAPGYLIAKDGRVISLTRKIIYKSSIRYKKGRTQIVKGKIISPLKDDLGYLRVTLSVDGKVKRFRIHRLLAQAFIPNPNNLPLVEHLNDNKLDNRLENLGWATHAINNKRAFTNGVKKGTWLGKTGELNPKSKKVQQLKNGKVIKIYINAREAVKDGFDYKQISAAALGKVKQHRGFQWEYLSNEEKEEK